MSPATVIAIASLFFAQKPASSPGWTLTFDEEFDGSQLDLTRWTPHDPWSRESAGFAVSGGQLRITSGSLSTFGLFGQTYGRFEIRCRVPSGRGAQASFRLLPVKLAPLPEIEVFEVSASDPSKVLFANRWGTEQTQRSFGDAFEAPDMSAGFHTIAAEWDRDSIVWSIDGKEKFRSEDGIPRQPMFLLIEGSADVDYVRAYRRP